MVYQFVMKICLTQKVHMASLMQIIWFWLTSIFLATKTLLLVMQILDWEVLCGALQIVEGCGVPCCGKYWASQNKGLTTILSSRFWAYSFFHSGRLLTWQVDKNVLSVLVKRRNSSYLLGSILKRSRLTPTVMTQILLDVCVVECSRIRIV